MVKIRTQTKVCKRCGKEYTKTVTYAGKFCSAECRNAYRRENPREYPGLLHTCELCGKEFTQNSRNRGRFCSKKCYGEYRRAHPEEYPPTQKDRTPWNKGMEGYHSGQEHWHWHGGLRKHIGGYVEIYCPTHPQARHGGYVYEHRLVMEKMLGRLLTKKEKVHHINSIRNDNRPENLQLFGSDAEHLKFHREQKKK